MMHMQLYNYLLALQQHGAIMDFSRLYEGSNVVDEHRDMRLDIDSMTYEVRKAHSAFVTSPHTICLF